MKWIKYCDFRISFCLLCVSQSDRWYFNIFSLKRLQYNITCIIKTGNLLHFWKAIFFFFKYFNFFFFSSFFFSLLCFFIKYEIYEPTHICVFVYVSFSFSCLSLSVEWLLLFQFVRWALWNHQKKNPHRKFEIYCSKRMNSCLSLIGVNWEPNAHQFEDCFSSFEYIYRCSCSFL